MWAGLLHTEKALTHLHLTAAMAGGASLGRGAWFGAAAVAGFALVPAWDFELCVFAVRSFFQRDFHGVTEVVASVHLTAAATTTTLLAKDVTKDVAKRFTKTTAKIATPWAATHVGVHARMAVLVVGGTLLRVRQHFVGLFDLFELRLRLLGFFALVAVRVVLHREFAISLFDLVI